MCGNNKVRNNKLRNLKQFNFIIMMKGLSEYHFNEITSI